MRIAEARLESVSPYSQSKHYKTEKLDRELSEDYEKRTWRDRVHATEDGNIFIPPMAFKNCIAEAAKFLGQQIPGKGKSTYTKHFEAGILVIDPLSLPIKKENVAGEWLFVPADGRRGGSRRVEKCFPVIHQWTGMVSFQILDEIITESVFHDHLVAAGKYIGIGRFRPRNNGYYGRFQVKTIHWS